MAYSTVNIYTSKHQYSCSLPSDTGRDLCIWYHIAQSPCRQRLDGSDAMQQNDYVRFLRDTDYKKEWSESSYLGPRYL